MTHSLVSLSARLASAATAFALSLVLIGGTVIVPQTATTAATAPAEILA